MKTLAILLLMTSTAAAQNYTGPHHNNSLPPGIAMGEQAERSQRNWIFPDRPAAAAERPVERSRKFPYAWIPLIISPRPPLTVDIKRERKPTR